MGQLPDTDIPFVDIDAYAGAKAAVSHLIESGHQHIAMITNAPLSYTSAQQRRNGYMSALKTAGIPVNESQIKEGNYMPASGFQAMNELLNQSPHPTAVFIASDVVAMGALRAIKARGLKVPENIAVVGFDDIPLAEYFDPPLTTVRLPAYGLGWAASERLIRLIRGEGLDQNEMLVESELIIRTSSVRKKLIH